MLQMVKGGAMRVPWLAVGVGIGILAVALLLPACSDLTGTIQTIVVIGGLLCGLVLGVVLDDFNRKKRA